jgi:ubiquitin-like domain-containing CTD phosphatase 1
MLVGTPSAELEKAAADEAEGLAAAEEVDDDFDLVNNSTGGGVPLHEDPSSIALVNARSLSYQPRMIFTPRPGKRLLVLDLDYTIYDHRSTAEDAMQLARPHLHEFLERAYVHYDILIWSATSMRWIVQKLTSMGLLSSPERFRLLALFDHSAMCTVNATSVGPIDVKPLAVVWARFPEYSARNTIMVDDLAKNCLMNPQSGLRIRPCRNLTNPVTRDADAELKKLACYLEILATTVDDFTTLGGHRKWESLVSSRLDGVTTDES